MITKEKFIKAFIEIFECANTEINGTTKYQELDFWDSMSALMLIAMCDSEFNLKLTGADIRNSETIDALFEILESK